MKHDIRATISPGSDIMYLDFSEALDTVFYDSLISKLKKKRPSRWVHNCWIIHTQRVIMAESVSKRDIESRPSLVWTC